MHIAIHDFAKYLRTNRSARLKAIPLQAWADPESFRRLSSQISRESAHEGGKVVSPMHRPPLPPGNIPGTHFC